MQRQRETGRERMKYSGHGKRKMVTYREIALMMQSIVQIISEHETRLFLGQIVGNFKYSESHGLNGEKVSKPFSTLCTHTDGDRGSFHR